jgi:hypothetical protein
MSEPWLLDRALKAEAERDRYREALEDLAGESGCTLLIPPDPSVRREGDPCRDRRPDRPETWCYACVASHALAAGFSRTEKT